MAEMRAVRYHEHGDPSTLTLETVQRPSPGRGEVLVDVRAAGINPIDTYIIAGNAPPAGGLPATAGSDVAGVVSDVGDRVSDFEIGDRVYATALGLHSHGSLADYVVVPASVLAPLPETVPFANGAAAAMSFATAWRGLRDRGELQIGDQCLVSGAAGGVGHAAVQVANTAGSHVIALARPETAEFVRTLGADVVLDYRRDDLAMAINEASDGQLDVVLETHADSNLQPEIGAAGANARIVVLGEEGPISIDSATAMTAKQADLDVRFMSLAAATSAQAPTLEAVAPFLSAGQFEARIDSRFGIDEAPAAYRRLSEAGLHGRVIVDVA
jgi:NADPH2:quinone reductase